MISVVIGFKNRSDYRFENTLLSLSKQTKDFELIVVDFGSSEENYSKQLEIVSKYGFKNSYKYYPQFKDKAYSMGWAHNLGLYQATGDIVFFLGSDTMISKNAINILETHFKNVKYAKNNFRLVSLPWVWAKYSIVNDVIYDYDQWLKRINEQRLLEIAKQIPHNVGHNFDDLYIYGIHTHIFLSFATQTQLMKVIKGYDLRFYGPLSEEDDIKERTKKLSVNQFTEYNALMYHQEHENDGINKLNGTLVESNLENGIMSKKYEEFNTQEMIKARFDINRPTICNQDKDLWESFTKEISRWK